MSFAHSSNVAVNGITIRLDASFHKRGAKESKEERHCVNWRDVPRLGSQGALLGALGYIEEKPTNLGARCVSAPAPCLREHRRNYD